MEVDAYDSVRKKVEMIFAELVGDRAGNLAGNRLPADITSTIREALCGPASTEQEVLRADQIAFNLTDWNSEAAFLVALHLFPEKFTPEEIKAGIDLFLIDVPAHVIAAARLGGYPTEDYLSQE